MKVKSDAGTDLMIDLKNTNTVGVWGWTDKPGTLAHWPGGLVVSFPNSLSVYLCADNFRENSSLSKIGNPFMFKNGLLCSVPLFEIIKVKST